ncbi:MAG: CapA family protein [bacterium]|nr:CapA family protein [bacterium]
MRLKVILITAALALFIAGAVQSFRSKTSAPVPEITERPAAAPARTLTVTATGDCTFATDSNADIDAGFVGFADRYGYEYFFKNMRELFSSDDLTLINFEGTLSENGEREDKQFAFRGDPEYVKVMTSSSVEAANLANNHSSDYGSISLQDTRRILEENGILTCRGKDNVTVTEINGIQVGLVGINYLNDKMKTELEDALCKAKDNGAELIILSIHWGIEKETEPNEEQIEAAHRAVDCGADLVIGTHPHVLQGYEIYKGKYILYSLGNFCFGGNNNPSDKDTAVFRQTFTLENGSITKDDNAEIIPCRISSHSRYNDYQPFIAEGDEAERILKKIPLIEY